MMHSNVLQLNDLPSGRMSGRMSAAPHTRTTSHASCAGGMTCVSVLHELLMSSDEVLNSLRAYFFCLKS